MGKLKTKASEAVLAAITRNRISRMCEEQGLQWSSHTTELTASASVSNIQRNGNPSVGSPAGGVGPKGFCCVVLFH